MESDNFMQNTPYNNQPLPQGNPNIRLPFESRKVDFATWTYIHRAGIYMIVIVFLLCAIGFVSCKIQVGQREEEGASSVLLDFEVVKADEQEERLERIEQLEEGQNGRSSDYSNLSNRLSNENAQLNSNIRDAQGSNASELYKEAGQLKEQMAANRAEYEAGLRSEQNIYSGGEGGAAGASGRSGSHNGNRSETGTGSGSGSGSGGQVTKVTGGNVAVSFSFKDPVRTANRDDIVVPAYMCEGGGVVVVNVTLNRNGDVISASADRALSSPDEYMRSTAERAARNSHFNVDNSAPVKHNGTIKYIFKAQ